MKGCVYAMLVCRNAWATRFNESRVKVGQVRMKREILTVSYLMLYAFGTKHVFTFYIQYFFVRVYFDVLACVISSNAYFFMLTI